MTLNGSEKSDAFETTVAVPREMEEGEGETIALPKSESSFQLPTRCGRRCTKC